MTESRQDDQPARILPRLLMTRTLRALGDCNPAAALLRDAQGACLTSEDEALLGFPSWYSEDYQDFIGKTGSTFLLPEADTPAARATGTLTLTFVLRYDRPIDDARMLHTVSVEYKAATATPTIGAPSTAIVPSGMTYNDPVEGEILVTGDPVTIQHQDIGMIFLPKVQVVN